MTGSNKRKNAMAKILLVEDDLALKTTVENWLTMQHYSIETAETGDDAVHMLRVYEYDAIVLDWELPGMHGIEVLKEYRRHGGKSPVIMLTGKVSLDNKEQGLDSGADDYLTKPFELKELSARLRAVLRRPANLNDNILRLGRLSLDPGKYRITMDGTDLDLAPTEFSLLEFLMRHPNEVFSADALLERVWAAKSNATSDTVRAYVKRVRDKIDGGGQSSMIKTVHGVGYKLEHQ